MKHFSPVLGLFALVCVSGCGGAGMNTYTPVHEKTKYSPDSLRIAARDAIEQLGYQPAGGDSAAHVIETREKQIATSSIPRLSYKYAFHIDTSGGVLDINATCVQNSATSENTFSDCGDDRPQRVINEQKRLLKRILEIAPNAESKNYNWAGYGEPEPEPVDHDKDKKDDKADKGKQGDEKSDKKDEKADKKSDKKDEKADKKSDKKDEKADKKSDKKDEKADKKSDKKDDKEKKSAKAEKSD